MDEEQLRQIDTLARKILNLSRSSLSVNLRFLENAVSRFSYRPYPGTFGTDGEFLYYQPMHILARYKIANRLVAHDCLHAILHCVFRHGFVNMAVQADLWDLACDIAVEYQIASLRLSCVDDVYTEEKQAAFEKLKGLVRHMTAEHFYAYFRTSVSPERLERCREIFTCDDHSMWYQPASKQPMPGSAKSTPQDGPAQDATNGQGESGSGEDSEPPEENSGENAASGSAKSAPQNGSAQDAPVGQGVSGSGENSETPEEDSGENTASGGMDRWLEQRRILEQTWRELSERMQSEIAYFSKARGVAGGEMSQSLRRLNRERYDYSEFLKRFAVMGEVMKLDLDSFDYNFYSYGLRAYGNVALIEPLEYRDVKRIREFVIAIDTSGSVSGDLVQKFMNKTYNILKSTDTFFSKVSIWIIQCDAQIQEAKHITKQEEFDDYLKHMTLKGFGGTDFRPVFRFVDSMIEKKLFSNLKGLIYFTDGFGTFPERKPSYETAFVFLRNDYESSGEPSVPPWAIRLVLEDEDIAGTS